MTDQEHDDVVEKCIDAIVSLAPVDIKDDTLENARLRMAAVRKLQTLKKDPQYRREVVSADA